MENEILTSENEYGLEDIFLHADEVGHHVCNPIDVNYDEVLELIEQ